ncbi:MAG: DUF4810 domain-containing protein [Gammaproteobacteria bacterium]|nr:DUF4810 domain-containing protein [Gammaproteobacteria bacterium]
MKKIITILSVAFIVGCATVSQSNLYWGNYSHTLYEYKKNPNDNTKMAHQTELQSIVEKSKQLNLRVPPGIYAELGVFAMESGDSKSANQYFLLERETYPESSALMAHVIDK